MAQYGYGGQSNPFDQRDNGGYGGNNQYNAGGNPFNQGPAMGRDEYGSNNVEMESLAQNAGSFGGGNANNTLGEVSEINRGIDMIDGNLNQLRMLQQRALDDSDSSGSSNTNRQLDVLSSETMSNYRSLTERVRKLKSNPASQQKYGQQVSRVDRRLKDAIREYQQVESAFRKKTQDQMARQYRIVRPEATESEVREAVEDQSGNSQVFQQALMQSNRRGQAQAVLNAVQDRHQQLQKIEQQMIELAQLFEQMDQLIVEQDVAVTAIEQKAEDVVDNLDKGNQEMGTAVNTARATRKKKWICLGICVAIVIIIAIIVAVYVTITNNNKSNNNQKRNILQPSSRSWFESEPVPQLTERAAAEAKRWLVDGARQMERRALPFHA
ncbi:t-SNARE [Xylariomycetidae sp. FL2044]|nr:t-SNARE [Xylariomycetidae sp. FL2044]